MVFLVAEMLKYMVDSAIAVHPWAGKAHNGNSSPDLTVSLKRIPHFLAIRRSGLDFSRKHETATSLTPCSLPHVVGPRGWAQAAAIVMEQQIHQEEISIIDSR
jgi:Tat protein secretion system quality control protein TatD with DNase activity